MHLDCLDDCQDLQDSARTQSRALRSESEPHDGVESTSLDKDVLDSDVLRLTLNLILKN